MTRRTRSRRSRPQSRKPAATPAGRATAPPPAAAPAAAGLTISRRLETTLAVLLLVLCALNMTTAALQNTAVADELGAHIPAGFLYWTSGLYSGGIDNFPLGQLAIAAPVRLLGLDYELFTEQHLLLFRAPVMALGMTLMVLIWRFARRLAGPLAGLAALGLATLAPNLLAHATLATLDLPTTFVVFLSVVALHRFAEQPSPARVAAVAAAIAAALVVKIQAVLLLPYAALVLGLTVLWDRRRGGLRWSTAASWLLLPVAAVLLIDLVYLYSPFADGALLPAAYLEAFRTKLAHGGGGHFAYLLGSYSSTGWWYYFPLAILVKTPLPALLLAAAGAARRPSREVALFVLVPMALFLGAGMAASVNIGLRHVLPIYPFLYVLAGLGAARLMVAGGMRRLAAAGLIAAHAAAAVWIYPHHLSYFNLLAGGPSNGHRVLLDSNYDWGQNDRFLARHVTRTGLPYRIDPDPFVPTTGPILVNANALYGILNGGPAAYQWLREREPVDRIAYTWFEYLVPGEGAGPAAAGSDDRLGAHLAALREGDPALRDDRVRLPLARALAAARFYGPAFDEVRAILAADPADEAAFRFGAELIVRHKLGVLRYRGLEYLEGFPPLPDSSALLAPADLVEAARAAGAAAELSTLYTAVGFVHAEARDLGGALGAFRVAAALDPDNRVARDNLAQLEAIAARLPRQ